MWAMVTTRRLYRSNYGASESVPAGGSRSGRSGIDLSIRRIPTHARANPGRAERSAGIRVARSWPDDESSHAITRLLVGVLQSESAKRTAQTSPQPAHRPAQANFA